MSARIAFLTLLAACICSTATNGRLPAVASATLTALPVIPEDPASIAAAPDGGLYIADLARNQILERSRSGSYTVIAGTGSPGLTGDGGPAIRAKLNHPHSLLATNSGALYFVQTGTKKAKPGGLPNTVIREITPNGILRTVAGLHPSCATNHAATSISAQSAFMNGAELSYGPVGVLEVSTNVCPNVNDLGPFLELTASGELRKNSLDTIGAASISCGDLAEGQGFAAFVCESGGGATAFGHPKELLVVRSNGSTATYPAYGGQELVAGDGEVVAVHNYAVVRVTSHRISTLVSDRELDGLSSDSPRVAAISSLAVDQDGDVFLVADLYRAHKPGCRAVILERAPTGALKKFWSATSGVCG